MKDEELIEEAKRRAEYLKRWRERNKEKRAAYAKLYHAKWYKKNKEKKQAQNKEWDKNNKEKRKEISKRHRENNKESYRKKAKKYRERYPEKVSASQQKHKKTSQYWYSSYKSGALRRGYEFELTKEDFLHLIESPCLYCGVTPSLGVDRLNNRLGYTNSNSKPCCTHCNRMKWAHDLDFFLDHITKIGKHRGII